MNSTERSSPKVTLFGRDAPQQAISEVLERAQQNRGGGLVCRGVAGIGKSLLLENAIADASSHGFDVRRATGVPIETALPFGSMSMLFAREIRDPDFGGRFPVLAAAMGLGSSSAPSSVISVATEALQHLSECGRDRPVLLVIDDVQWVDLSSMTVIAHIARHAVVDRIAVLIAARSPAHEREPSLVPGVRTEEGEFHSVVLGGIPALELQPLTDNETHAALLAAGCSVETASLWALHCGGLPLAIAEVARRSMTGTPDARDIASLLPMTYRELIVALPPRVADTALVAAICPDVDVLTSLGLPALSQNLRKAERAGLLESLTLSDPRSRVKFRHPLLRAAVLAVAKPDRERAVHRMVAGALIDKGLTDRAALHLAAGADGPDSQVAEALRSLAERSSRRGALAEAATAWTRAAALTADADAKSAFLAAAADARFDSGDAPAAFALVDAAVAAADDSRTKADAQFLRGRMSTWTHSPTEMVRQLDVVADAMRDVDPARAAAALASSAGSGFLTGDLRGAMRRAAEAEHLASAAGNFVTSAAAGGALAWNSFLAGDITEFDNRMGPFESLMRDLLGQQSWAGIHLAEVFCLTWVCAERWEQADPLVRELVQTTRTMGASLTAASSSLTLSSLCWRQGRWDEAYALARPLLDMENVPPVTLSWMQALVAQLSASMGLVDETRTLVALVHPFAASARAPTIGATANAALGHLELSLGNNDAALALLDRVAQTTERMHLREPEFFFWHGDHFDALLRTGRHEEATERLRDFDAFGERTGRLWVRGVAARTHAQLETDVAAADAQFDDALRAFEQLGMPFEVARTLLMRDHGTDRADARRLFLRLGAAVWADAALAPWDGRDRRTGPTPTRSRVLDQLSPAEQNVAMAMASGRTNREIAAELHLSTKTVDHYLQRAFRRLGLRNRTELAIALAQEVDAPQRTEE